MRQYFKYLVLIALVILAGFGMYFFQANMTTVFMLITWVFVVAAVFAVCEKILRRP